MATLQMKRVTVTEREYNDKGDLVKETETVTEYQEKASAHPVSPWTNPPFNPPYVSHI